MKKKILPFILVFIVLIVCSIFIFYIFKDNKNNIPATDVINKENVVNDSINTSINTSSDKDVIIETQDEEKQTIHDVDNKEEKTTSEKQDTTNQTTHKNNTTIKADVGSNDKEEVPPTINKNDDEEIIVDKETMVDEEIDNSDPIIEKEENDSVSQEDQEFERLQSLIKYKTDKECYDASFDVTLEYMEDENFKVISCISYAYKGRLVGYRMIVHFWDGTTQYLDAID